MLLDLAIELCVKKLVLIIPNRDSDSNTNCDRTQQL